MFVVQPTIDIWFGHDWQQRGRPLPDGFRYASDTNPHWLSIAEIQQIIAPLELEHRLNHAPMPEGG
jgi:UDP-N-acetylglucosamine 4,6-dehydratase/5-epimerase